MAIEINLHFISDPGHGWLAVERRELQELGIAGQISRCSYVHGDMAYLEEDCDAAKFIEAMKARHPGAELRVREEHQDPTPIRGYRPYPGK